VAEPPDGVIWNRLKRGRVVPFLGAGASLTARPPGACWDPDHPASLPSGAELSRLLAEETSFPFSRPNDVDDLATVSSYYCDMNGRRVLRERLRELLVGDYPCSPLHHFLASLDVPLVFVVTNYDTLLEQAFLAAGRPYDLVIHPADRSDYANAVLWWPHGAAEPQFREPNRLEQDIDLARTNVIYKMHGSVCRDTPRWDNFVITEDDYIDFLSRMTTHTAVPSLFSADFRDKSFLFLGYGLRDWNLRVVLKNLGREQAMRTEAQGDAPEDDELPRSWAIQRNPSEFERRLWEARGVSIFDVDIDEFIGKLRVAAGGGRA
jgi:hypothetical protein